MKDKMASCGPDSMQKDMEERLTKQSRTFQRIFERLRDEHGHTGGESAVAARFVKSIPNFGT